MNNWRRNGAAVSNVDTAGFLEYSKQRQIVRDKNARIENLENQVQQLNQRLEKQDAMLMEILKHVQK